jgi:hypothetical protein
MFPGVMGQVAPYASHLLGGSNVMGSQADPTNSDRGYGASIYNALAGGLSQRTGIAAEHAGISPGFNPSGFRAPGGYAVGTPGNIGGNYMVPAGGAIPNNFFDGPPPVPQGKQASPQANITPNKKYKRPAEMRIPGGFSYLSETMHPLQREAAVATFDGPFDYHDSLFGRRLINEQGGINMDTEVLPTQWEYFKRRGLNVGNNELTKLADLLYT